MRPKALYGVSDRIRLGRIRFVMRNTALHRSLTPAAQEWVGGLGEFPPNGCRVSLTKF